MSKLKPDLRSMAEQLARLIEVSVTLNSTLNQQELLQYIISTAAEILDCESVSILLYYEKRASLIFAAATGADPKRLIDTPVPLENSLAGTIFRENKNISLSDIKETMRTYLMVSKHVNFEIKNLLGVPMRIQDKPTGVLEALNKRTGEFDESDVDILTVVPYESLPAAPASFDVSRKVCGSPNVIWLEWVRVPGAQGYRLYRNGDLIETFPSSVSMTIDFVKNTKAYQYALEAFSEYGVSPRVGLSELGC